ncbi:hypothetical protein N2152v2_008492 [Parachlorella kessleri]
MQKQGPAVLQARRCSSFPRRNLSLRLPIRAQATQLGTAVAIKATGTATLQGTSRKQNEDRLSVQVADSTQPGQPEAYAAVFDGHGGNAVANWLEKNFIKVIENYWTDGKNPEAGIREAFVQADKRLLQPQGGFLGMGERGVGGSKCGASAAIMIIYRDASGKPILLTANAGDARVLLARNGRAVQLTEDHVPDNEDERKRIERENPNPRMPLVRFVGGTWRVGGILALSRAFGDAYMKGSLQFEGVQAGSDGYSTGFGVIATPYTALTELTDQDGWVIVSSDGLNPNLERGSGGGLSNDEVVSTCERMSAAGASCDKIAQALAQAAVKAGSNDDVTVVVLKLK